MILRSKFFKKVLIGSIFALQFTVTFPTYNALAVIPDTKKTHKNDYTPLNVDADKELLETHYDNLIKKYNNEIDDKQQEIKSNSNKFREISLYLRDNITEEEKQYLQKKLDCITDFNDKLLIDVAEISEKLNKVIDEKKQMNSKAKREEVSYICHIL